MVVLELGCLWRSELRLRRLGELRLLILRLRLRRLIVVE